MAVIEEDDSNSRLAVCASCGRPQAIRRTNDNEPFLAGVTECVGCSSKEYRIVGDSTG